MPNVMSQIHPRMDGGNALMKALLEVTGLGLCNSEESLMDFVGHTLLFCQSSSADLTSSGYTQKDIMDSAKLAFDFLIDSRIIELQSDASRYHPRNIVTSMIVILI